MPIPHRPPATANLLYPDPVQARDEMGLWLSEYLDDAGYSNWSTYPSMYKARQAPYFPSLRTRILGRRTARFSPPLFLTAPRMVLPKILVLARTNPGAARARARAHPHLAIVLWCRRAEREQFTLSLRAEHFGAACWPEKE